MHRAESALLSTLSPAALGIIIGVLLVAAFVFGLVLQGYSTLALVCLLLAAVFACVALAPLPCGIIALVLTIAAIIVIAIAEVPIVRAARTSPTYEQPYLIVLGAKVNGTQPSKSLRYRLEGALDYLERNPDAIAVVSGGQGSDEEISEAQCMATWLEERGISPDRIIEEDESTDTDENLANSFSLIREHQARYARASIPENLDAAGADACDLEGLVAVASSSYHLYRVGLKAEALGETVAVVPCYPGNPVLAANYFLREAVAVWAQWIFAR